MEAASGRPSMTRAIKVVLTMVRQEFEILREKGASLHGKVFFVMNYD